MRIYSMTATFGKLEKQTITFDEGLNIIEAPNEWGKSTWCAFLVAMLYGISTREQTKTGFLADKEHYAPWSGQPMAGRIELCWEGRDITIERSSTARVPFGEFKAYETASGLPVRELTGANCGLQLLGVEKEVFLRSGFLRLKDLPVTADDSLRRRLNSLVTTGSENDACDDLAQKLKDLKNACYLNSAKGLIPQAQAQKAELEEKIRSLQELQVQLRYTRQQQEQTAQELAALENHLTALRYEANRTYQEKLTAAQANQSIARLRAAELDSACKELPELSVMQQSLSYLQSLQDQRAALQLKMSMLTPPVLPAHIAAPYAGATPDTALEQTQADAALYEQLLSKTKGKGLLFAGLAIAAAGVAAAFAPIPYGLYAGIGLGVIGILLTVIRLVRSSKHNARRAALEGKYAGLPASQWITAAQNYVTAQKNYMQLLQEHQAKQEALQQQAMLLEQSVEQATGSMSLAEKQQDYRDSITLRQQWLDAQKEARRCDEVVQALESSHQECPPPSEPDALSFSEEETLRRIAALQVQQSQLLHKLGQFQGQTEALGSEAQLQALLTQVRNRIAKLEMHHKALLYALELLDTTKKELQRRFAPQISKRATALMKELTGGRYDRLHLEQDLTLCAAADGEPETRKVLWRSDGTADQLYLSLRLAVSEELLPDAPFILDDALVRFDDTRLAAALALLQQIAAKKQVILFTCQSREKHLLGS